MGQSDVRADKLEHSDEEDLVNGHRDLLVNSKVRFEMVSCLPLSILRVFRPHLVPTCSTTVTSTSSQINIYTQWLPSNRQPSDGTAKSQTRRLNTHAAVLVRQQHPPVCARAQDGPLHLVSLQIHAELLLTLLRALASVGLCYLKLPQTNHLSPWRQVGHLLATIGMTGAWLQLSSIATALMVEMTMTI